MYRCLGLMFACRVATAALVAADEGIPEKTLNDIKAATVYVKVETKEGLATGSGFLIRLEGEAGYVATNHHVIGSDSSRSAPSKVSVVFWSGSKKEMALPAEVVADDAEADLAVLKVTAKNLPAPLDLTQTVKLRETMTVYSLGFPLGDLLSGNKGNPALTIGKATVSSLREDERGKVRRIQIDGELNPGNSGGPVVDPDGKLVGIAVSKITNTKIGFAIPAAELTDVLKGRVAAVTIKSLRINNGEAQLEIEVPCVDPLHKIKSVELRHVRKDTLKEVPLAAKEGVWPELPGSEKIALKIEGDKGKATVTLKCADKKAVDYVFQTAYTVADAKPVASQPLTKAINFAANGVVRLDEATTSWETIVSKEGGLTVDMPVKPTLEKSRTRKTSGGTVKIYILGAKTDTGIYLAYRIDQPTAVIKGAEDALLDAERDAMAEEWNGKVVGEKKVRASGNVGRDFTIKGKPDDGPGVIMVRVRQYLVGKTIYCVTVVSATNKELPLDTGRFLGSLAIGEAKTRAAGTPEPDPVGTEMKDWGLAMDPDKDCKITAAGEKAVTIEVPGATHDLSPDLNKMNSPRVMREVDGDFVLTVKVAGEFKPGPKSTNPMRVPYLGAGILVWSDSDNHIRLERANFQRGGKFFPQVAFLEREGGYAGAVHNEAFKDGDCYLRMERKGSRIQGAVSADGKTWKQLKPIDTVWPDKLKLGLVVITTSSEPMTVKFEEFELKTKSAEGNKK